VQLAKRQTAAINSTAAVPCKSLLRLKRKIRNLPLNLNILAGEHLNFLNE
jgi:hypothetical protein